MKPKILYIEDEAPLRHLYERVFVNADCEFYSATNVEEGLNITNSTKPHIVLLDIIFPGQSNSKEEQGYVYLRKVKDNPDTQDIPVVAFSNLDTVQDREKSRSLGASAYLLKRDCMPKDVLETLLSLVK